MITLVGNGHNLILPDLEWFDEFDYSNVVQTLTYTLTGALIVERSMKLSGRSIKLRGGSDFGWMQRTQLNELLVMSKEIVDYTLTIRNTSRTVNFTNDAIIASPVVLFDEPADNDNYIVTLSFIEI